jgi:hypothetical protein
VDNSWKKLLVALNNQIDLGELQNAVKEDKWDGEFTLSEDGFDTANNQLGGLLTLDAAKNNRELAEHFAKDLYPKHKKSATQVIEDKLIALYDKFGVDYSQYNYPSEAIGDLEQKVEETVNTGDSQKLIDSLKADLQAEKENNAKLVQEADNKVQELQSEYAQKELYKTFQLKANSYTWADAYADPDLKDALLRKKWDKINAKAHLQLAEDGEIKVFQKDMPDKELYNGNKIETFQNLLEPEIENYLKKSSPEKVNEKKEVKKDEPDLTPKQRAMLEQKKRYQMV